MGSAVTPSPLLGEGWGGGIARHSQIKGLFFKRIQRRAPSLTLPPEGGTRGGGVLCVLSNSLTRPTSRTARLGGFASVPHILIEYIYRFAATKGIAAGNREMQVRRSSGSQRGLGSLSLPLAGRSGPGRLAAPVRHSPCPQKSPE